jgi:uncharacterized protein
MNTPRTPQLIIGEVGHTRTRPVKNAFRHSIFNVRLPLENLPAAQPALRLERIGLLSFFSRDHGYRSDTQSLTQWAHDQLCAAGIVDGPLHCELVCLPRVFGHVFNPVSFWLCWSAENQLRALIAEVNNTFGERLSYVLVSPTHHAIRNGETLHAVKQLHVSPFNEVRGDYRFRVFVSDQRFMVRIDYDDAQFAGETLLTTHISGHCQPLTYTNVRKALLAMPFITLQVVAKIHWQALKLIAKRVPFYGYLPSKGKR